MRDSESGLYMMQTSNRSACLVKDLKASDDSNAFQKNFVINDFPVILPVIW